MKKNRFLSLLLPLVLIMLVPAACIISQKNAGYSKIKQTISKDSADQYKKRIVSINNNIFIPAKYTGTGKLPINYRLLSPAAIKKGTQYPLVLVLHSSGRPIGTDNVSQMGVLAKLWAQPNIRNTYPAYVLVPQFPVRSSNYVPTANKNILASTPDPCLTSALQLIDSLKKVLPINDRKIYVIGFSMGGSSTINSLGLRPNMFAAAVSISGIPEFKQIKVLAKTPIWFIHGNADTENPIGSDSLMYKQLQLLHAPQIKYWEVEGLQHEIYPQLYKGDAIPAWLFKHTKN